ncbi:DNA replication/repair protein RecF [Streptococcus oralis]|uniref:DNA replication/repair protein RecF n=1 Tax=Streptococcus oralis TaxID=1303 RepID=UPI0005F0E175|nr:DNA replication/repair protein RecF [Streptococcus oralis]KJQ74934.1 recombination protein F [Streptococcus oralis subsp. tigurinus]MCY7113088.1 DNA replication/repair protein RecF [Streptococcus oralis]
MWLQHLTIKTFRNYKETKIDFNPKLNVFLGQNAQGKTNILEAIYFLALTRSHRTRTDKNLIHFDEEQLHLSGLLQKKTGSIPLEIDLTSKGRVTKVNHLKQARLSDYIGHMNVVLFAPEDLQLIKGAPSVRRKFIDIELGQIKPIYLSDLSNYNHILKQRNTYLKSSQKIDETFLSVLDDQLVEYGCRVIKHRIKFIKELEKFGQKKHLEISNQLEELSISYQSSVNFTDEEQLTNSFKMALEKSRSRDLFKKNTGVGPHRDDIAFYINGMNASFGSQGQHRSLVLSIKLAEIELMESITNESPILLLDDVMSELDNTRQLKLLETISQSIQTFITTTTLDHLQNLPENLSIFNIQNGQISVNQS